MQIHQGRCAHERSHSTAVAALIRLAPPVGAGGANSSGYPGCPLADGFKAPIPQFDFEFQTWL